jgi:uncharacterized protein YdhG (YjbR/CyaY superfamily)
MDKIVTDYIKMQKSPQKEICQKLREMIFKALPNVDEEMKWGVPTFAKGKLYVVALKDHVNLGYGDGGKKMKHIEIKLVKEIDSEKISDIIKLVS